MHNISLAETEFLLSPVATADAVERLNGVTARCAPSSRGFARPRQRLQRRRASSAFWNGW
ncbi:MAG: hypothetical protein R3D46_10150 [Defluviimonas denitrificans]